MEPRPPDRTSNPPLDPAANPQPQPGGVRIFLKPNGARGPKPTADSPAVNTNGSMPPRAGSRPLLIALFLADFVLCSLAWLVIARSNGSAGWLGWALVIAAVGVGAWLSVLAFLALAHRNPPRHLNGDHRINGGG
jgi:hypothetical protein